jgi:hypothetical protein
MHIASILVWFLTMPLLSWAIVAVVAVIDGPQVLPSEQQRKSRASAA